MLKTSIIIPTYNRPVELENCVRSILAQTVRPSELIIVDDGALSGLPLETECREAGINYVYFKKDRPGLTESRNTGIRLAHGDILFFLDDDVLLSPVYVEEILHVYGGDTRGDVMGVCGVITNFPPLRLKDRARRAFETLFLLSGPEEGKVLPSGFCVNYGETGQPIQEVKRVDFFPGGACSFRREVFREFSFDSERYHNYGLGEDKDFSYSVARKYRLLITPRAKLEHLESPSMRPNKWKEGRMFILDRYLFFRKHVRKSRWSWVLFYYALSGYLLARVVALLLFPNRKKVERLRGVFSALGDIFSGRALEVK